MQMAEGLATSDNRPGNVRQATSGKEALKMLRASGQARMVSHKGPSIKDVRKNLPFFDPPRPGVSEITENPPPPGRPHFKNFLQFQPKLCLNCAHVTVPLFRAPRKKGTITWAQSK